MGILIDGRSNNNLRTITLTLKGKSVVMHIDTGAEVTVISQQMLRNVGQPELLPIDLHGPDQGLSPPLGSLVISLQYVKTIAHACE